MCGRTTNTLPRDQLAELLDVAQVEAPELPVSWNVAPTQPLYVMGAGPDGSRKLKAFRWGLVPSWSKDPGSAFINARAETLSEKPAFRSSLRSKRAIVPISGFYEWYRPPAGEKAAKQPFYFQAANCAPLAVAALWDVWRGAEGTELRTVALVTTEANETMRPVHHRMPAILAADTWDEWLHRGPLEVRRRAELLVPAPDGLLDRWEVGPAVNSVKNDGPDLVATRTLCSGPKGDQPK